MSRNLRIPRGLFLVACLLGFAGASLAQDPPPPGGDGPPPMGPGGFGPPGGFGGPMSGERKLVKEYDKDGDKVLNKEERTAAREALKKEQSERGGRRRGFGPPPGMGGDEGAEPKPGQKITPADVRPVPANVPLYDAFTLRTIFLDFEDQEWEAELGDFSHTDVEVPATMTVDGQKYQKVGVSFRGASSLFGVRPGQKRSLNVSVDAGVKKQALLGYRTLNLLNSHEDPSFLRSVLYAHVARQFLPTPKVNLVRVVINGENWGVYGNAQQYDATFIHEAFPGKKGIRWKAPGSPRGQAGLDYVGDDVEEYKRRYDMKGDDDPKAWDALIALCKTLSETPPESLEQALTPMFDIDGALKFLAVEDALVNNDGYWVRASDYALFREKDGKFHIVPHDMNETFSSGGGFGPPGGFGGRRRGAGAESRPGGGQGGQPGGPPGPDGPPTPPGGGDPQRPGGERGRDGGQRGGGPPRSGGVTLDPLVGMDDLKKPLRSKLLAVPALREKYLRHVKAIAENWLDWKNLGPIVAKYRTLIEAEVKADTRKLTSFEAFQSATSDAATAAPAPQADGGPRRGGGPGGAGLRSFADQRRKFLLEHAEVKKLK